MKPVTDFLFILLLGSAITIIRSQAPHYGRGFYSSVITPTSRYSYHTTGNGFVPLTYKSDLVPEESKHRSPSKYSKKSSYRGYGSDEDDTSSERYTSDEYSNEAKHSFASKEQDSREYTIGTHIRVQHPITVPKKITSSYPTKSAKYTTIPNIGNSYSLDVSHEEHGADSYLSSPSKKQKYTKHYEPDPFHVIAPPQTKSPSYHTSASRAPYGSSPDSGYNVYEPESETYDNSELTVKHLKSNLRDRYKEIASKKQIEKYLEDQEKLLDDALKLQLLNSPKFKKLLKSAEKENKYQEHEFDDEYVANIPPPFRESFPKSGPPKSQRSRRRPPGSEFKRAIKSKPTILSSPKRKYRQAYVIEV